MGAQGATWTPSVPSPQAQGYRPVTTAFPSWDPAAPWEQGPAQESSQALAARGRGHMEEKVAQRRLLHLLRRGNTPTSTPTSWRTAHRSPRWAQPSAYPTQCGQGNRGQGGAAHGQGFLLGRQNILGLGCWRHSSVNRQNATESHGMSIIPQ